MFINTMLWKMVSRSYHEALRQTFGKSVCFTKRQADYLDFIQHAILESLHGDCEMCYINDVIFDPTISAF